MTQITLNQIHALVKELFVSLFRYFDTKQAIIFLLNNKVKVKVKFTLQQATKAQRWSRGIALLFL